MDNSVYKAYFELLIQFMPYICLFLIENVKVMIKTNVKR